MSAQGEEERPEQLAPAEVPQVPQEQEQAADHEQDTAEDVLARSFHHLILLRAAPPQHAAPSLCRAAVRLQPDSPPAA
jgi:hypothetical protein